MERFEIFARIDEVMGGVEKSEMPNIIADLLRDQVITVEDLAVFSDGCREMVLASIR